jgi:hypothetical protein
MKWSRRGEGRGLPCTQISSSVKNLTGGLPPRTPRIRTIHSTKLPGRPGNPAFLPFVAGLLRSNRGDAPRSPLSGVLTPPDPPKGLICKPVEPVASPAPVLDSYAILLATVTTLLTLLNHRTVWRGSGGSNSPPSSQCQCPPSSQCQCGATVSEI